MRQATRIPTHRPNRMPTPVVRSNVVSQRVDLKPAGNSVAVTALADNPFEGNQAACVVTQASGGAFPCPQSMASKRVATTGFLPGVAGLGTEFMPGMAGLGEDDKEEEDKPGFWDTTTDFLREGYGMFTDTQIAEQQRRAAEAEARAAESRAAADIERSRTDRMLSATRRGILDTSIGIGGMQVNVVMLAAGAGLLWYAMSQRGKAAGGKSRR